MSGIPLQQPKDVKGEIMNALSAASGALDVAWKTGFDANALASELPAFQKMQALKRDINDLMLQVSKLRGL